MGRCWMWTNVEDLESSLGSWNTKSGEYVYSVVRTYAVLLAVGCWLLAQQKAVSDPGKVCITDGEIGTSAIASDYSVRTVLQDLTAVNRDTWGESICSVSVSVQSSTRDHTS